MENQGAASLVSVVIPTRNRAQLLSKAIKSVQNQSYPRIEIIVVDENSSDDTPALVESFRDIHYIRHEVTRGPGASRNAGVAVCQGEYVAFLDDDDEFLSNKLKLQVEAFEKSLPSVGVVISGVQTFRDGKPVEFFPYDGESGNIFHHVLAGHTFPISASLVRRKNIPAFDDKLQCLEDVDFHLKLLQDCEALYVDTICAIYNLDGQRKRLSEDSLNMHRSFRIFQDRWFKENEALAKGVQADLLVNFARRLLALGFVDEATREYFNKAFRLRKDGRRAWYKLLNLFGPSALKTFVPRVG